jgi:hypothetical protein
MKPHKMQNHKTENEKENNFSSLLLAKINELTIGEETSHIKMIIDDDVVSESDSDSDSESTSGGKGRSRSKSVDFGNTSEETQLISTHFSVPLPPPPPPQLINSENEFDGWTLYNPLAEFERMGLYNNDNMAFHITTININYLKCPTYPQLLCVPITVTNEILAGVFRFRSKGRIPVICWKSKYHSATISRCSQPFVGVKGARCPHDEVLLFCVRIR